MFINRCLFCSSTVSFPASLCPSCRTIADAGKFDSFAVRCPGCARPLVSTLYKCPACTGGNTQRIFSIYDYRSPFFRHILEQWKFEERRDFSTLIAEEFYTALKQDFRDLKNIVIVPVPCSRESLKKRKWDQMKDIALCLKRKHGLECLFLIENNRSADRQQKTLDRSQRINASEGKYSINMKTASTADTSKTYIVIDDTVTTGSTIRSCMNLLKDNGFEKVQAFTLMAEL